MKKSCILDDILSHCLSSFFTGTSEHMIFIFSGTNDGKIMLFHLGPRCSDAVLVDGLQTGFKAAVTVLASSPSYLGCGNNDGCVIVWQSKSPYQKLQCFEYRGLVCVDLFFVMIMVTFQLLF